MPLSFFPCHITKILYPLLSFLHYSYLSYLQFWDPWAYQSLSDVIYSYSSSLSRLPISLKEMEFFLLYLNQGLWFLLILLLIFTSWEISDQYSGDISINCWASFSSASPLFFIASWIISATALGFIVYRISNIYWRSGSSPFW